MAGKAAAGAADARDGGASGLPADPDEPLYYQGNAGVPGTAETGDQFAAAPVRLTWRRPRPRGLRSGRERPQRRRQAVGLQGAALGAGSLDQPVVVGRGQAVVAGRGLLEG